MRVVKRFSRRLKTARWFVFENIMDLDHVCALHRKWFHNLRIHVWNPEYVEYRLASSFYGFKQDLHVRGAPIDAHRYWYEFNGRFARIRVEGLMEGPEGDLTLTETISYNFHWIWAPLFLILSPLLQRQKGDILHDDSRLLEGVYELEEAGFRRGDGMGMVPKVVVYGGSGFFGRLLVRDLLQRTDATIAIASRSGRWIDFGRYANRVKFYFSDMNDLTSVRSLLEGARIAVCCVGPYQGMPLTLLQACIEQRVHYVDVADDRDFFQRASALRLQIEAAGIMAFVGCSVVPGMSSLLTRYCLRKLDRADRVGIFISPGTRHTRGPGSFACLLSTIGEEYAIPWKGGERKVRGWTERRRVEFPPPLGARWVYSVVDIADHFTQPLYFGTKTVEFKIGSEMDPLNRLLAVFRRARGWFGIRNATRFIPFFRRAISLMGLFGSSQGGLMVEVSAGEETAEKSMSLAVVKGEGGQIIPALLPAAVIRMILRGGVHFSGVATLSDVMPLHRFQEELEERGVRLFRKLGADGCWTPCSPSAGAGDAECDPPITLTSRNRGYGQR